MKKARNFLKISGIGLFIFTLNSSSLFSMPRLYFEKEDLLLVKILVLFIGMVVAWWVTAKGIYPQLLTKAMDPFKARNIFNATVFAFFVLLYGITFHTMVDILYFSIAVGVIMIAWMFIAIIKN